MRDVHDEVLALRHWVISHAVSVQETVTVGVEVRDDGSVGRTRVMLAKPDLPGQEFATDFQRLVTLILADLLAEEIRLHGELAAFVRAMPRAQLARLPELGLIIHPGPHRKGGATAIGQGPVAEVRIDVAPRGNPDQP
jgi:hypothetical protein